jgi:dTDP-4-dehydrorhamnose reductase
MSPLCGNFHVSGAGDITYAEFALHYVAAKKLDSGLVVPTTAAKAGVNLLFSPTCSALGTTRTQQLVNIAPQSLSSVVEDLLQAEQKNLEIRTCHHHI